MKQLLHKIAHLLSWNYGRPDAFWLEGKLMMSFVCSTCGKRSGVHEIEPNLSNQVDQVARHMDRLHNEAMDNAMLSSHTPFNKDEK